MSNVKSLTEGTPWKLILSFATPIMIGQVFQLIYSIVDTKVVGAYLGEAALASVGSVSTLYNLLNSFANGLTLGFGIIMAMYFGAKNLERVKKTFGLTILMSLITVGILMAVVFIFLNPIMQVLNVPAEQMIMAGAYIRILTGGLIVTVMYHMCANSLRALGDAMTPLMFLILASLCNVGMDYLFVFIFQWGVAGAATATVLAQLISVILCLIRISRKFPILHVRKSDFVPEKALILEMYKSGLSLGLMNSLVGFGTVILQSAINQLGTTVIVAHVAARKVNEIMFLPIIGMGGAMANFSGQNYGAGRFDRIRTGLKSTIIIGVIWSAIVVGIISICSKALIQFLASTTNPEIIRWGSLYMRVDLSFMFVCFLIIVLRHTMQGFGDRVIPVISSAIELAGKIIFALILVPIMGYWGVIWTEPIIWICMVIPLIIKTIIVLKREA